MAAVGKAKASSAAAALDKEDGEEQQKSDDIRDHARFDQHEAARNQRETLHRRTVVSEIADQRRRKRNHAEQSRKRRGNQPERRRVDHQ